MMRPRLAETLRRRRFDVDEVTRMAEAGVFTDEERLELVAGELVVMPTPGARHAGNVDRLTALFHRRLGQAAIVRTQNPLRLDQFNLFLPDVTLLRPDQDYYRTRHPGPEDTLLVVEVADSTMARDRGIKLPKYARAGVPRVWILDLQHAKVLVFAEPGRSGYASERVCAGNERLGIPEDGEITAAELLGN